MSSKNVGHLKKVFVIVRQKLSCSKVKQTICSTSTSTRWSGVFCVSDYESRSAYNQEHRLRKVHQLSDNSQKLILNQKNDIFGEMFNRSEYNSMDEHDFATRQSSQAVKSRGARLLWFCALSCKDSSTSSFNGSLESEYWVVHGVSWKWILLTENHASSSGQISQSTQHCSCFVRSKTRWQRTGSNLDSSKIESSSCRCTTASIGDDFLRS